MQNTIFFRSAAQGGLILGSILVLYSMLLYVFEVNIFSIGFGLINFLLTLALFVVVMMMAGINARKKLFDGYMSYKDAFVYSLILVITASLITAVYNYFYHAFADLAYLQAQIDQFLYDMQQKGLTETQLKDLQKRMNEQFTKPPIKMAFNSFLSSSILGVVLALLVSIFIKQNRTEYDEAV